MTIRPQRHRHHLLVLHVDPLHNLLDELTLRLGIVSARSPVRGEVCEQIDCALKAYGLKNPSDREYGATQPCDSSRG